MPIAVPKDGSVVTDPNDGHRWLVYKVGNWYMSFDIADGADYDLGGMQEEASRFFNGYDILSSPQFVGGGKPEVLTAVANGFGSMATWWDSALKVLGNPDARGDSEIQRILVTRALRPTMSETEFRTLLQGTKWYQDRNETQRKWNDLGEADQKRTIDDTKAKLRESYLETFGRYPDDATIDSWSKDVASGALGYGAVVDAMRRQAAGDSESPWSRTLRSEEENRRARGQQVSDLSGQLRDTASKWGVELTGDTLNKWSTDIVTKVKSSVDFEELMKDQAMALYPNKPRELATQDYAQSWMSSYARILEKSDGTLQNGTIKSALQRGVNLADFETELRNRPEWMETKNANDQITTSVAKIGARMGFE